MPVKTNVKAKRIAAAKDLKKEQESIAFNNTLWVFCSVIILEAFLIVGYEQCAKSGYYNLWFQIVLSYARFIFPILTAAAVVMAVLRSVRNKGVLLFVRMAVLFAALSTVFILLWVGTAEMSKTMCIVVPLSGLLLFILFTYQLEFFLECLVGAFTIITMLAVRGRLSAAESSLTISLITIALDILFAALAFFASKNMGRIKLPGRYLALFDRKTAVYTMLYISCIVSVLSVAGGLIFGSGFAYAAICVQAAFLFIAAVFHTVKLM